MPGARCTRSLVCSVLVAHERSHHGRTGITRHSRTRMVLTAYFVLSPATNSSCHRHRRIRAYRSPVGLMHLRQLDTSNGCQDHTALPSASAPFVCVLLIAHGKPPCDHVSRLTLPRPPHPVPTSVTMANAPLAERDGEGFRFDLGISRTEIFLKSGLDSQIADLPDEAGQEWECFWS
jgi:hypothetical protein